MIVAISTIATIN